MIDGQIVLDETPSIPEGTRVRAEIAESSADIPTLYQRFQDIVGIATDLPEDFAGNHDHSSG